MSVESVLQPIERKKKRKMSPVPASLKPAPLTVRGLEDYLHKNVIGIPKDLTGDLADALDLHGFGLSLHNKPIGSFLLSGSTGCGKTLTAEAVARFLHGNEKNVLKIHCGEFQMEHEVAKLIGAPPGYLGHRETTPMLNQQKLNAVTSEKSQISVVLFDEFDKAAPSLQRLLLGVLDKAELTIGDNTKVNFERTLIFFTTNFSVREKAFAQNLGFTSSNVAVKQANVSNMKRRLPPEFIARLTGMYEFPELTEETLKKILDLEIHKMVNFFQNRRNVHSEITLSKKVKNFILQSESAYNLGARLFKEKLKPILLTLGRNHDKIIYLPRVTVDMVDGDFVIQESL